MCKVNPKKSWKNYYQNRQTKEFIEALESALGIPRPLLIQTTENVGNADRGTHVHIKIAGGSRPLFALFVYGYIEALESVLGIPRTY